MSTNQAEQHLGIYCPAHRISFPVLRASTILCAADGHALSQNFPYAEYWEYCCDCQQYWPSDVAKSAKGKERCASCEREIVRRYLCDRCKVLSQTSDENIPRRTFRLTDGRGIRPSCPGCLEPAGSATRTHQCPDIKVEFATPLSVCPFCHGSIGEVSKVTKEATAVACQACGASVGAGQEFCGHCGAPVKATQGVPGQGAAKKVSARPTRQKESSTTTGRVSADQHAASAPSQQTTVTPSSSHGAVNVDGSFARLAATPRTEASAWPTVRRNGRWVSVVALLALGLVLAVFAFGRLLQRRTPPGGGTDADGRNGEAGGTASSEASQIPEMSNVPGGKFMMGSLSGDEYERPPHEVTVKPLMMDTYEVTCEQYARFIKETQHAAPPGWRNGQYPAGAARQPVAGVNWDDANAYAKWAGKRLPTEEEWEFAARGKAGFRYPWGNEWKVGMANTAGGASEGGVADVGTFKGRSPFGLYDMVGNVWEWTASSLEAYPGGHLPSTPAGEMKVIRGGSWREGREATTTYRGYLLARGSKDYSGTGFRCVRDEPTSGDADRQGMSSTNGADKKAR